jgi:acyl-ACP thioesterase
MYCTVELALWVVPLKSLSVKVDHEKEKSVGSKTTLTYTMHQTESHESIVIESRKKGGKMVYNKHDQIRKEQNGIVDQGSSVDYTQQADCS